MHGTTLYGLDITASALRQGVVSLRRAALHRPATRSQPVRTARCIRFAASGIATAEGYVESAVRRDDGSGPRRPAAVRLAPGGRDSEAMPDPESVVAVLAGTHEPVSHRRPKIPPRGVTASVFAHFTTSFARRTTRRRSWYFRSFVMELLRWPPIWRRKMRRNIWRSMRGESRTGYAVSAE